MPFLCDEGKSGLWLLPAAVLLPGDSPGHRVHTKWQLPISGVRSIMMEISALAGRGGGARPPPFKLLPSRTKLQCTLQLRGQIQSLCFNSTHIFTQWPWLQRRGGEDDSYPHYSSGFGPRSSHSPSFLSGSAPHCSQSPLPPIHTLIYTPSSFLCP